MSDYLARVRKQLQRDEDVRLKPYVDTVGKLTIGCGRNLTDRGISLDEADYLLDNDIAIVLGELVTRFPWTAKLDEVRQAVLVNMGFNMGVPKLAMFTTTLDHVKNKRYADASVSMLKSKWAGQVGNRAKRLSEQMRTGQWA
jgi:lysozyme